MLSVILANVWRGTAFSMMVYNAALQRGAPEITESAEIDGANALPALLPHHPADDPSGDRDQHDADDLQTLGVFTLIWVMTGGGPGTHELDPPGPRLPGGVQVRPAGLRHRDRHRDARDRRGLRPRLRARPQAGGRLMTESTTRAGAAGPLTSRGSLTVAAVPGTVARPLTPSPAPPQLSSPRRRGRRSPPAPPCSSSPWPSLVPLAWLLLASVDPSATAVGHGALLPHPRQLPRGAEPRADVHPAAELASSSPVPPRSSPWSSRSSRAYPLSRYKMRFNRAFLYTILFGTLPADHGDDGAGLRASSCALDLHRLAARDDPLPRRDVAADGRSG